jgi:hypothetical protein
LRTSNLNGLTLPEKVIEMVQAGDVFGAIRLREERFVAFFFIIVNEASSDILIS